MPERSKSAPHAYSAHDIASTGCSANALHRLQRHQPAGRATHRLWFGLEKVAANRQQERGGVWRASKVRGIEVWSQVLSLDGDLELRRGRMDGHRRAVEASMQHRRACGAESSGEQHRAVSTYNSWPWTGQGQSNLMGRLAQLHGQQNQLLGNQLELFRCRSEMLSVC